jgi:hypothetical protein
MILHIYTIIHTLISLVAIVTGFIVLFGLLAGKRLDGWTKWFLISAVATTVTGFFFPFHGLTPAFKLGIISAVVLAITIYARYPKNLRPVALDLRHRRRNLAVFQHVRSHCAVVRKSTGIARDGADSD